MEGADRSFDARGPFSIAQADTYLLAECTFVIASGCNKQGWRSRDLTEQPGSYFHVDAFLVVSGDQSLWCGVRASNDPA